VYEPFLFTKSTVTGTSYLDMLQEWLMPQVEDDSDDFIHQQDGLYHITTTSSASPSISSCPSAGLDKRPQKTRCCFLGHQDHLTQHHAIVFMGIF